MKSLNRFLGMATGVFLILLIAAVIISTIYVSSNKNIFTENNFGNGFNNVNWSWDWPWSNQEHSKDYETVIVEDSKQFDLPKNMYINVAIDEVIFIEESRTDVRVEYFSERPDTSNYEVEYATEDVDDSLYINSQISIRNLILDSDYESYIKIHVPLDFPLDRLELTMSMGEINQSSILENVTNLKIDAQLGDVNLDINGKKETLTVNCSMGNIDLTVDDSVETLDVSANFGKMDLKIEGTVNDLYASADMGDLTLNSSEEIQNMKVNASMGNIDGTFRKKVDSIEADCSMGNIHLTLYDNEASTVYADASMGNVNVNLPMVKESADPDFRLTASMGNIDLKIK